MTSLWVIAVGLLAAVGGVLTRRRITRTSRGELPVLSDDVIRAIETDGYVEVDEEPLDLDTIQEEEERFWDEPWEESEEW
jgi:hypothetical protein